MRIVKWDRFPIKFSDRFDCVTFVWRLYLLVSYQGIKSSDERSTLMYANQHLHSLGLKA